MTALRALLTFGPSTSGPVLIVTALNTSDEAITVVRSVRLRLPDGQHLPLAPDLARELTSTRPFPVILHPEDRVALTIPVSFIHAALAERDVTMPIDVAACFIDMTDMEYLSPVATFP